MAGTPTPTALPEVAQAYRDQIISQHTEELDDLDRDLEITTAAINALRSKRHELIEQFKSFNSKNPEGQVSSTSQAFKSSVHVDIEELDRKIKHFSERISRSLQEHLKYRTELRALESSAASSPEALEEKKEEPLSKNIVQKQTIHLLARMNAIADKA